MSDADKNPKPNALFAWQDTKVGLVFIVLFNLFLVYVFVILAIDTGSLIQYFVALVFLALAIGQGVKLVRKVMHRG